MVFTIVSTPGSRKIRIRRCVNAPLKKAPLKKIHEGLEIGAVTGVLDVRKLVQDDLGYKLARLGGPLSKRWIKP